MRHARILAATVLMMLVLFSDAGAAMTGMTGGSQPHENMQPWLGVSHIIALQGVFPSRNLTDADDPIDLLSGAEPGLGEITLFGGNFAPRGWAFCDGQLLPIAQNSALFSILGTTYGGDGRTTFGLPDLRGRGVMHTGAGLGLTPRVLGETGGVEDASLSVAQMPSHDHTLPPSSNVTEVTGGGQAHGNMQPYLGLNRVIALNGLFPSRNLTDGGETLNEFGADPYIGGIGIFAGNYTPRGWARSDGQLLSISENSALFAILGTTYGGDGRTTFGLPDLRGRFAIHEGEGPGLTDRNLGEMLGTEQVTLAEAQMPSHHHTLPPSSDLTGPAGGGQGHPNMQPSLALNYVIALNGIFPSRNITSGDDTLTELTASEPLVGEIGLFAGNFAPRGWAFCDGQLLPISSNTALFSILGTTYGGDGRTNFALPDLRGRVPIHPGTGIGLTRRRLGEKGGLEDEVLGLAELPAHDHVIPEPATLGLLLIGSVLLSRRRR